jgi:hypothetical protein
MKSLTAKETLDQPKNPFTYTEDYKYATKQYIKCLRNPMVSFKNLGDSYIYLIGLANYLQNGIGCKDEIKELLKSVQNLKLLCPAMHKLEEQLEKDLKRAK